MTKPLHVERVAVRWSDMDSLGHVNNALYFTYCETARMGLFDRLRVAEGAHGTGPVLKTASCTFERQLTFPAMPRRHLKRECCWDCCLPSAIPPPIWR